MATSNYLLRNSLTGYAVRSDLTGWGAPQVNLAADGVTVASNLGVGTQSVVHCAGVHATGLITLSGVSVCSGCKNNTNPTGSWSAFGDPNGAYELCRYETTNNVPIHLARVTVSGLYVNHYTASGCAGSPDVVLDKLSIQVTRSNTVVSVNVTLANAWIDDDGNSSAVTHRKSVFVGSASASGCVSLSCNNNFTVCPASFPNAALTASFIFISGSASIEF